MPRMILPAERDPRLITTRRGGTLSDADITFWLFGLPPARSTSFTTSIRFARRTHVLAKRSTLHGLGFAARCG
jgi:hypothetical protein